MIFCGAFRIAPVWNIDAYFRIGIDGRGRPRYTHGGKCVERVRHATEFVHPDESHLLR